jgi:hypothetical protein
MGLRRRRDEPQPCGVYSRHRFAVLGFRESGGRQIQAWKIAEQKLC